MASKRTLISLQQRLGQRVRIEQSQLTINGCLSRNEKAFFKGSCSISLHLLSALPTKIPVPTRNARAMTPATILLGQCFGNLSLFRAPGKSGADSFDDILTGVVITGEVDKSSS